MDTREYIELIRQDLNDCGITGVYVGLVSDYQKNGTKKLMPRILFENREDIHLYKLVGKYIDVNMELQIEL